MVRPLSVTEIKFVSFIMAAICVITLDARIDHLLMHKFLIVSWKLHIYQPCFCVVFAFPSFFLMQRRSVIVSLPRTPLPITSVPAQSNSITNSALLSK